MRQLWIDAEHAITDPLNALETMLSDKEIVFEKEQARLAEEKAEAERQRVEGLYKQLEAVEWAGISTNGRLIVAQMTQEQFKEELDKASARFEELKTFRAAELERQEREAKAAAELAEANRKEAERLAAVAAEQKAQQDRLDAAKREQEVANARAMQEIKDREAAALQKIKDAEAAAEAKRQADLLAEKQREADRLAAERRAEADKEAQRLRELQAPDREKVAAWADKIDAVLKEAPILGNQDLQKAVVTAHAGIMGHSVSLRSATK